VDDVCEAVVVLMNTDFKGPIDIGTGQSVKVSDICPNLPIKPGMAGERPDTLADITKMRELGWEPKWTVKKFLDENGYEHKLQ
jgi:nucleoside-diphosphate-sugar epimerase